MIELPKAQKAQIWHLCYERINSDFVRTARAKLTQLDFFSTTGNEIKRLKGYLIINFLNVLTWSSRVALHYLEDNETIDRITLRMGAWSARRRGGPNADNNAAKISNKCRDSIPYLTHSRKTNTYQGTGVKSITRQTVPWYVIISGRYHRFPNPLRHPLII